MRSVNGSYFGSGSAPPTAIQYVSPATASTRVELLSGLIARSLARRVPVYTRYLNAPLHSRADPVHAGPRAPTPTSTGPLSFGRNATHTVCFASASGSPRWTVA